MSLEETLLAAAKEASGDDTILGVALFHPRGYTGATGAGAGVGSAVGGDSSLGSAVGAAVGGLVGMKASGAGRNLPLSICVAISGDRVYLMEHRGMTDFAGDVQAPFAVLDRSQLGVEVHRRAMNRVVILHDESTDEIFPMEAPRLGPFHAKAMVELLMLSDRHHDQEAEEASTG